MIMTLGIGSAFMTGAIASSAAQESYPWCTQGETLHCYYMTHEQCELTVDYHGFCVANPEVPPQMSKSAPRSPSVHGLGRGAGV